MVKNQEEAIQDAKKQFEAHGTVRMTVLEQKKRTIVVRDLNEAEKIIRSYFDWPVELKVWKVKNN